MKLNPYACGWTYYNLRRIGTPLTMAMAALMQTCAKAITVGARLAERRKSW